MSANEINLLLVDAQLTTANTDATDAINQALSAFSSLGQVSCPYVTTDPVPNPDYDSSDTPIDITTNPDNPIDKSGNSEYLENDDGSLQYITLDDIGAVFNYAYDPANKDNSDIANLQYQLSGLYDQLSAFDPDFASNVSSSSFSENEFTDTFSNYVDQLNTEIASIDPTLDQLDMLPETTTTSGSTSTTVIDWNSSTSENTKTNLQGYTTALTSAKSSGSTVSTTLSTQTQYDMSIYTQYTEAMLSFVSTQSTINQRMWS